VPPLLAPFAPQGALVGAVSQIGTGFAIPYATATVQLPDGSDVRQAPADSLGGFAILLAPGTYRVRVQAMAHRFEDREVQVRSAAAETLRVALRYAVCRGY
jgi:hypothetical protein